MTRTIIRPPGRLPLPDFGELWRAREVFYRFGQRDVLLRYRQTAVGVAWVVIQPLLAAGIFSIVFGGIANLPSGGIPYIVFSFAGLLGWNLFNGIISRASTSLVANQALVSKVYFPRILVPLSSVISVLLDFVVALMVMVVLLIAFGVRPGWAVLLVPVWMLITCLFASGIAVAAAAGTVKYRDIAYVIPWLLQILLYASPVAYSLDAVPSGLRWLVDVNPIAWLLEAYRWSFLDSAAPAAWQLILLPIAAVVVALAGLLVFQRMEREFADVI